ncbi:glycosyltransferase family 2 protein [Aliifodinibius sp. S!AR15-10]|uniref:glycosyltransferase family 2 protein n=1 Tax=Aliifodinibius sp. S!AR15-10 TaxID=2950437 RepID=UPI0028633ACA|nr:glycosyltransferase family 2 protein [Aliifodinibius sp. S!AR15-10]MDR8393375.1 glycosyltransferase family 2 protein [Aliifodinibius sp. S!AR15-10]
MGKRKKIAVLLTCHNRKQKTLNSLHSLFKCDLPKSIQFSVFLVDDGSTDGTSDAISKEFPEVELITGDGNLFWNQGMRLAWKTADKRDNYDFFFWLNDDTILDEKAFHHIFNTYKEAKRHEGNSVIITAACRAKEGTSRFSYGGRDDKGAVIPNGELQSCKLINGNAVLIPRKIVEEIGNLSDDYTHAMGDFDYGLRAIKNGFACYTTKEFVATCPPNDEIPNWCNPKIPLKRRWQLMHSPQGLNIQEHLVFREKFWGIKWVVYALKAYLKVLFPRIYRRLKS